MLANGATLSYRLGSSGDYTALPNLKEIPDIGMEPEKVENTDLSDSVRQYELGIGDPGDMVFKFKYVNKAATDSYRLLRTLETNKSKANFKLVLFDGTAITFDAQVAVKLNGGGVNAAIDFDAGMCLQSAISISDPSGTTA